MNEQDIYLGPRKKEARNLAKKLIKDARITEAPVSLQKVIEHIQKEKDLVVRRIENIGNEVSGILVRCKKLDDEFFTIGFNANQPWCRRRFTIAHEIGHLLFGHSCEKDGRNQDNEKECDVFASEVLIPTEFLKKDFARIPNIPELAKLYRVSEQAMGIKISDSRIIKW